MPKSESTKAQKKAPKPPPEHGACVVTFYTKETAPHKAVVETMGKWTRLDALTECERPELPHPSYCAACHFGSQEMRKARAAKMPAIRQWQRTGKLPLLRPSYKPEPLYPAGFDPGAVVLPYFPTPPKAGSPSFLSVANKTLSNAAGKYLAGQGVKGETEEEERETKWACGCETRTTGDYKPEYYDRIVEVCKAHMGALRGRDEDTGEYLGEG